MKEQPSTLAIFCQVQSEFFDFKSVKELFASIDQSAAELERQFCSGERYAYPRDRMDIVKFVMEMKSRIIIEHIGGYVRSMFVLILLGPIMLSLELLIKFGDVLQETFLGNCFPFSKEVEYSFRLFIDEKQINYEDDTEFAAIVSSNRHNVIKIQRLDEIKICFLGIQINSVTKERELTDV